jgi:FAD:protein FMN transferase
MTPPLPRGAPAPADSALAQVRAVRLVHVMGTVISIDVRSRLPETVVQRALDAAAAVLSAADREFSTYRPDSWISRLRRHEIALTDCPPPVPEVVAICSRVEEITGGCFTARWRGDGTIDPTGLVKGWAAGQASAVLKQHGIADHCVNAAGDLALAGHPRPGPGWRIGIADPRTPGALLGTVDTPPSSGATQTVLCWPAVATSGTAERGQHVVDPHNGRPTGGLLAATVAGPDPAVADGCATGLLAAGAAAANLLPRLARYGYAGCLLEPDGQLNDPTRLIQGRTSNGPAGTRRSLACP